MPKGGLPSPVVVQLHLTTQSHCITEAIAARLVGAAAVGMPAAMAHAGGLPGGQIGSCHDQPEAVWVPVQLVGGFPCNFRRRRAFPARIGRRMKLLCPVLYSWKVKRWVRR